MLRVVVREGKPLIGGLDVIVRVKPTVARSDFKRIVSEARGMLTALPGRGKAP
jgi:RNase P protein component